MRVKFTIVLAIASVLLLCSTGVAFMIDASEIPLNSATNAGFWIDIPTPTPAPFITGVPTAEQLTAQANSEIASFGFPDLAAIDNSVAVPLDTVEAATLESPICGVCGSIPECTCAEKTTVFNGPAVNLGCPIVNVATVPVNLVSPVIAPIFPAINVRPQATVVLPQVNTKLNCFDINCLPVTNINPCPTFVDP